MDETQSTVLVTGIAGNLGERLVSQLSGFRVLGVDMRAPNNQSGICKFETLDLGAESSCQSVVALLHENNVRAVIHLAFVIDPLRTGILNVRRMWEINVAGTARVMEAVAEVNRHGGAIKKFIFPSSVSAYGPELPPLVDESYPLEAHTLPYAVHKAEADEVAQLRADDLGDCRTYILRPHIFTGASMQNYLVGALRGTATGHGKLAESLRKRGKRLPMLLPFGARYGKNKFQFVHVDDVARLIVWLLQKGPEGSGTTILNVAGRGEPITIEQCLRLARAECLRLPGKAACRFVLQTLWAMGISGVPAASLPYITGSYTMSTKRLQQLLGKEYEKVIRFTVADALAESFANAKDAQMSAAQK